MISNGRAAQQYLQTQVRSRTPLELVVMLYDGAVRSAAAASDAMERRDIPARRAALSRTMAIIGELQGTLDMERGGKIAEDLDRLYSWMTSQLMEATIRQSAGPILDVRRVLQVLQDGWQQIAATNPAPGSAA